MKKENIFVTGASGFIGGALVKEALEDEGIGKVYVLLRSEKFSDLINLQKTYAGKLEFISGTLDSLEYKKLADLGIGSCVHCAWISTPGIYLESPLNEDFVTWSNDLVRKLIGIGVRHFTILGTCIEYKLGENPLVEEQTPIEPSSLYARCKVKHFNDVRKICTQENDKVTLAWGRVFYPYGVGEHHLRLCTQFVNKLKNGERITLNMPGARKDYIYITDLANAILLSTKVRFNGVINYASGQGVPLVAIVKTIAKLLRVSEDLVSINKNYRHKDSDDVIGDNALLAGIGWQEKHNLETGLKKLIDSLAARGIS